jgi:glutamate formiminotransferase / 5-formyltetrahydrofolate cyclo-ligase
MRLIECVPNISEGRDPAVVARLVAAVESTPGVEMLDWSADPDHNRCVLTYAGEPEAVFAATQAMCLEAFASIDMEKHQGAHPRLGAVDVVPFVPVRGVTNEEAVALARRLGEWIGEQGVPVYYYQDACTRPERELLPDVRRGEYEGLAARISTPEWAPDAGPAVFNARSGASIVGVRFPLIAFNVNLATDDLAIAKRIAAGVRHSGGGYRYVRAMGVELADKGQVQVSLDITQYEKTPIHRVFETIKSEAAARGVAVAGCELIGLVPLEAFQDTIRHYLQLPDFTVKQVVESRLLEH